MLIFVFFSYNNTGNGCPPFPGNLSTIRQFLKNQSLRSKKFVSSLEMYLIATGCLVFFSAAKFDLEQSFLINPSHCQFILPCSVLHRCLEIELKKLWVFVCQNRTHMTKQNSSIANLLKHEDNISGTKPETWNCYLVSVHQSLHGKLMKKGWKFVLFAPPGVTVNFQ